MRVGMLNGLSATYACFGIFVALRRADLHLGHCLVQDDKRRAAQSFMNPVEMSIAMS